MRKLTLLVPVLASAAAVVLSAGPALAGTGTTFTVTGGTIAISQPGSVDLGSSAASVTGQTVSKALGAVTVTDSRGGVVGWTAQVVSTAFTSPGATSVPASAVSAGLALPTVTGIAVVTPLPATNMSAPSTVETATAVVGANTASWDPTITVAVPAGAVAGTYSGTITHSLL